MAFKASESGFLTTDFSKFRKKKCKEVSALSHESGKSRFTSSSKLTKSQLFQTLNSVNLKKKQEKDLEIQVLEEA